MNSKTKGEQSREKLIEHAAKLFLTKGYSATGINEILESAAMSKGSFYFYFSSKKELAIHVSEFYRIKTKKWLETRFQNKEPGWEEFINAFIGDRIEDAKNDNYLGCPAAVLGIETAFSEPDIAKESTIILKELIDQFDTVLKNSGIPKDKSYSLARKAFSIYEGHLLFYRISKDVNELEVLKDELLHLFEA